MRLDLNKGVEMFLSTVIMLVKFHYHLQLTVLDSLLCTEDML